MSAFLSDASGFSAEVVNSGSSSPDSPKALAESVEEAVSVKIANILAQSLQAEGLKNKGARALVSRAKEVTSAVSEFLSKKKDPSKLLSLGYNPSVPGMIEAFALGFLNGGKPEMAVGLFGRYLEKGNRDEFLGQFFPVFEAAILDASGHSPDDGTLSSVEAATDAFLKILQDGDSTGYGHFVIGRLVQLKAALGKELDVQKAFAHYAKGLELGEPLCAIMLSRFHFQNGQDAKAFEVLEFAWSRFRSVDVLSELSKQFYFSGRIAESIRHYRILSGMRRSKDEVTSFPPNAETLSFPRDLETIGSHLLTQESTDRFVFVERSVLMKANEWLRREFRARAELMERHTNLRRDEDFEDRLAVLQFGAIELSNADFAARYLDELAAMLSIENGKAFLRAFFEEYGSRYAEAFITRVEEGSLAQLREEFGIGVIDASSDVLPSEDDEFPDASQFKEYKDLWEAMTQHLWALRYRFQYLGDEDVLERILAVTNLLDDADGVLDSDLVHLSADTEDHMADLKECRERFERFPMELQDWYYSLREGVIQDHGESFARAIMTNAYYSHPIPSGFPVEAYLLYVAEFLISGAPGGRRSISELLSSLSTICPNSDDIARICGMLTECEFFDLATDVALRSDPSNPRIMRYVLQSVAGYPEEAENLFEELAESLRLKGVQFDGTIVDYVVDLHESFPSDSELFAISKGNAGLMFQSLIPDPELLLKKAIPLYDEAASLWDAESAFFAARCFAYWIKDREEAEKRFLALFHAGFDTAALDLFEIRMAFSDRIGAEEWLLKCERMGISDAKVRRITFDLAGDRNDRISAIRGATELFLYSGSDASLPEEILRESLRNALIETSPLGIAKVAFDSRMEIGAYLGCLRFIALLPPDAEYGVIKVPENSEILYWETLAEALSDPSLHDQAAIFLQESTGNKALNGLVGITLTALEQENADSPTLSALVTEIGLFREIYGIPSDLSESELTIDEETKVFITAFYTAAAQVFFVVPGGERLAWEYLTAAERFVPKRSENAPVHSTARH